MSNTNITTKEASKAALDGAVVGTRRAGEVTVKQLLVGIVGFSALWGFTDAARHDFKSQSERAAAAATAPAPTLAPEVVPGK